MKSWLRRFIALLQPLPLPRRAAPAGVGWPAMAPTRRRTGAPSQAAPASPLAPPQAASHPVELTFLAWLLDVQADAQALPDPRERQVLHDLARLIADSGAHSTLLPRATAVVPPLLARLRSESSSTAELAQYVARDLTLVAEVIRMANSSYYRRGATIVDLEQSIRVLGADGLRSAIARTLLKPLFDMRSSDRVAHRAARLWAHTEHKVQLCAALARSEGADPFEAYLLGLVHNAAWSVVLRVMAGLDNQQPWHLRPSFVAALGVQRDRLFGVIARQWPLTDSLTQVAGDVARRDLAATAPARRLYRGDRLASLLCDPDPARAASIADTLLGMAGAPVRDCYDALRRQLDTASA